MTDMAAASGVVVKKGISSEHPARKCGPVQDSSILYRAGRRGPQEERSCPGAQWLTVDTV
jgi:hypothetical protein